MATSIVNQIVAGRIQQPDCASGFLLDGYPRTLEQAAFLNGLVRKLGLPKPIAIHLDVPAQVLVSRITARRQCGQCGRIYNMLSQPPKAGEICDDDQTPLIRREDDTDGSDSGAPEGLPRRHRSGDCLLPQRRMPAR